MIGKADMKALADGRVAEEDSGDSRWVRFEKGHHEVVIDLQKNTSLRKVLVRTLNYNQEKIGAPLKVYVYTSQDGQTYNLASIRMLRIFLTTSMMLGLTGCSSRIWMKGRAM